MKLNKPSTVNDPDIPTADNSFDEKEFMDLLETEVGSEPLHNSKYELFCRAIFAGCTQTDAYLEAISPTASRKTANTEAARLVKRDLIKNRIHFLQTKLEGTDQPISRKEAIRACTDILRDPNATPDNKLKAIDRLAKMFKWFDAPPLDPSANRPDPAFLYQYIKRSQANAEAVT